MKFTQAVTFLSQCAKNDFVTYSKATFVFNSEYRQRHALNRHSRLADPTIKHRLCCLRGAGNGHRRLYRTAHIQMLRGQAEDSRPCAKPGPILLDLDLLRAGQLRARRWHHGTSRGYEGCRTSRRIRTFHSKTAASRLSQPLLSRVPSQSRSPARVRRRRLRQKRVVGLHRTLKLSWTEAVVMDRIHVLGNSSGKVQHDASQPAPEQKPNSMTSPQH